MGAGTKRISNRKDDLFHGDDWSFKKTGIASSRSIIGDHRNPEDWDFPDDGSVSEHSTYKKSGKLRSRKIFNQKAKMSPTENGSTLMKRDD